MKCRVARAWGTAMLGGCSLRQSGAEGAAAATSSCLRIPVARTNPLSGFPGTVGTASGDFHRIVEILLATFDGIFVQERQWPCCNCENENDFH